LPALDFVAVGEHRIRNARAIQERAVAALAILHVAAARSALNGKMHAGHKRVVRQSKLRTPRRPPDRDGLAGLQPDDLPRHRPFPYFQYYAHSALFSPLLSELSSVFLTVEFKRLKASESHD
jgi:hypothetical protein